MTNRLPAIYRFELGYQARRAWPVLFGLVLLVAAWMMARDSQLADAMFEDFYANSPFEIAKTTVLGGFLWLLMAAAVAGEAGAREVRTGLHPLLYTTPLRRHEYLGGRFLAALTINTVLLFLVQVGILVGTYLTPLPGAQFGPFRPEAYLTAFLYLSVPNVLFATAIQFALALRTGRPMAAYLGSFLLFFTGFFIATFVRYIIRPKLGFIIDPIGVNFIIDGLGHEWTVLERKVRMIGLEGIVLQNRLFWLAAGGAALSYAWLRFRFVYRTVPLTWFRRRQPVREPAEVHGPRLEAAPLPPVTRRFGPAFHLRQTLTTAWISFTSLATSRVGLGLLIVVPLLMVIVVLEQMKAFGTPVQPTTTLVLREMIAPLQDVAGRWVIIPPLIVFFAGQLVWRERDAGMGEIHDAIPGSEWSRFLGKYLGLSLVLALLMALLFVSGLVAQLSQDYRHHEVGLFLVTLFGLQLPEYLLFALLALVVHVVVDHEYLGYLAALMAYVFIVFLAGLMGIQHHLLLFGSGPGWMYTPMRGFGPFIGPWLWFKLYWAAWAVLLGVGARLLWVRGKESRWTLRLRQARVRLTRTTLGAMTIALGLIVGLGGFIFYNTNVVNRYLTQDEVKAWRAEYERLYGRFEHAAHPSLTRARLQVEIHPAQRSVTVQGAYTLVNHTTVPIDSIHVSLPTRGADTRRMALDHPASLALDDAEHGYRIYALDQPLAPGDSAVLDFELAVEPRGFGNEGVDPSIARQASFFTNASWFPVIGFQSQRALLSAADRRAAGLAARPILGALPDEDADASMPGQGVVLEAIIGTDSGQVAAAPGDLRRSWTEGGRSYFEYATSAPIGDEWAFFSGPYAIRTEQWNDVTIRIYHAIDHTQHLDRVLRSVRASLEYYTANFGPYRWRHLSIVERPGGPGFSAHADPSIIYHGESYYAWTPSNEPGRLDMPYAVLTHEMAHQWPHPYAMVEGLPFLGEGLAWYFGMQAVKASRGEEQLHTLRSFMRWLFPYPVIRRGEPLMQAMDPYMAYRKGPMAMYALSVYIGAERVNRAIRRMYEVHDAPGAPLATTRDLYRELQAVTPDSLQPLLHDFFEINASWDLTTEKASAIETAPGVWQVTLKLYARKVAYDTAGVVSELPLDQWVPVGVFAAAEPGHEELSAPLHFELHRIRSGLQEITVTVHARPVLAGIDPRHVLDWEEGEDDNNVEPVNIEARPVP